jgi:hypothetical protein
MVHRLFGDMKWMDAGICLLRRIVAAAGQETEKELSSAAVAA